MTAWERRPPEIANLLNPAFCSLLVRDSVVGFEQENRRGMPYPLVFIVLPLVLHKQSRECLPVRIDTRLHGWLEANQAVGVGFVERARQLVPYTKEGIVFGMQAGTIRIAESGMLVRGVKSPTKSLWNQGTEPEICRKKAYFVGRWLAKAGEMSTIYMLWGVCP